MRLGVWLPIVSAHPGSGEPGWQAAGTAADLISIATAAERLGYDCLCAPEHIAVPTGRREGTVYWDPLTTLGLLAGATSRVRLAVLVAVLGYHHPLELAKRFGTLQRIAGDRVVLGVGAGGTEPEFRLLGASFEDRGARADEALTAIQAVMGTTVPRFDGRYHRFSEMVVDPSLAPATPIWVGGASPAAQRRALRSANGWAPTGLTVDVLRERWARVDAEERAGFELVFLPPADELLDPLGDPSRAMSLTDRARSAGVTTLLPRLSSVSAAHYVDQLAALVEIAQVEAG